MAICHFTPGLKPSKTLLDVGSWPIVNVGEGEDVEVKVEASLELVTAEPGGRTEGTVVESLVRLWPVGTVWECVHLALQKRRVKSNAVDRIIEDILMPFSQYQTSIKSEVEQRFVERG